MKRVLVTGADGFVGRHVLPLLENSNLEIHAILFPGNALPEGLESVHWHVLDLMHSKSRKKLFKLVKATHLLHLAWVTEWGKYWNSSKNLDWLKSGLDMFREFAENGGQRIVGAGTCAEYDWQAGICRENTTPLKPSSLYGVCKHALHSVWNSYSAQLGLSTAWGRLFFLYGPYEQPKRLVPSMIDMLLKGDQAICTNGSLVRDYMHVQDAAVAFVALLQGEVEGPVNIASGSNVLIGDIVQQLADIIGQPDKVVYADAPLKSGEPPVISADVNRLRLEVGITPIFELSSGLRQTVDWWRKYRGRERSSEA